MTTTDLKIKCPLCGHEWTADSQCGDRVTRCPACGVMASIPTDGSEYEAMLLIELALALRETVQRNDDPKAIFAAFRRHDEAVKALIDAGKEALPLIESMLNRGTSPQLTAKRIACVTAIRSALAAFKE